jgi:hypothetical protein
MVAEKEQGVGMAISQENIEDRSHRPNTVNRDTTLQMKEKCFEKRCLVFQSRTLHPTKSQK